MPPIEEAFGAPGDDYRWLGPVHQCPKCESNLFKLAASFHDRRVSFYFTTMQCVVCGALVKAPTEVDFDET